MIEIVPIASSLKPINFLAPKRVDVLTVRRENHDTVTIQIRRPSDYPQWKPGQFNMMYLFGMGEAAISISGDPQDTDTLTHTIKAVGLLTKSLTALKPGEVVWIRGPYGQPWPDVVREDVRDLILIAGGIGLAPLRPVILAGTLSPLINRVIVLYGARTPSDLIFADDLKEWQAHPKVELKITVDRLDKENGASHWHHAVGVVTNLLHHISFHPAQTIAMTCGPEVMMRYVAKDLVALGMCDEHIFVSMERNMKCATGICGRCQWGPHFVCRDGPVYSLHDVKRFWTIKEF